MVNYLIELIKHPLRTGAIAPSSKSLGRLMINKAELGSSKTIVEFGPGNGVFTELISKKSSKTATIITLEINKSFADQTKKRCPEVFVYNDNAINIKKYLETHDIKKCDRIISSLPMTALSRHVQKKILSNAYDSLSYGGKFLTYVYVHKKMFNGNQSLKSLLEGQFDSVETTNIVWNNLPPAFVYCAVKSRK